MNGGFCQRPLSCCVQRQIAHCGRSISGANARGSFVRSALICGRLCIAFTARAPESRRRRADRSSSPLDCFTTEFRRPVLRGSASPDQARAPDPAVRHRRRAAAALIAGGFMPAVAVRCLLPRPASAAEYAPATQEPSCRGNRHRRKHHDDLVGPAGDGDHQKHRGWCGC